jgi:hypothetical protein
MSVIFITKLIWDKMEKNYLEGLKTSVNKTETGHEVIYELNEKVGRTIYKEFILPGINKPIRQKGYILTNVDMVPIIEELNKRYKLEGGELETLRRQIMEDSLRILKNSQ